MAPATRREVLAGLVALGAAGPAGAATYEEETRSFLLGTWTDTSVILVDGLNYRTEVEVTFSADGTLTGTRKAYAMTGEPMAAMTLSGTWEARPGLREAYLVLTETVSANGGAPERTQEIYQIVGPDRIYGESSTRVRVRRPPG